MLDEHQLKLLIRRATFRVRMNLALWWGCASALVTCLLIMSAILLQRFFWVPTQNYLLYLAFIPLLTMLFALMLESVPIQKLLLELDRRAGLAEHLTTWFDMQRKTPYIEMQVAFRAAQRAETIRRASQVSVRRCFPLRLPSWSNGIWLGILGIATVLLIPPKAPKPEIVMGNSLFSVGANEEHSGENNGTEKNPSKAGQKFKGLQIASQTMLVQARVYVENEQLDVSLKAELLAELEMLRGNIPEADLDEETRQILQALRKQVNEEKGQQAASGSQEISGMPGKNTEEAQPLRHVDPVALKLQADVLLGAVEQRFPDLAVELKRYYSDVNLR